MKKYKSALFLFLTLSLILTAACSRPASTAVASAGSSFTASAAKPTASPAAAGNNFYETFYVSKYDYAKIDSKNSKEFTREEHFADLMRTLEYADYLGEYAVAYINGAEYEFVKGNILVATRPDTTELKYPRRLTDSGFDIIQLNWSTSTNIRSFIKIVSQADKGSMQKALRLIFQDDNADIIGLNTVEHKGPEISVDMTPAPTFTPEPPFDSFYTDFDVSRYDYSIIDSKSRDSYTKEEDFAANMRTLENGDFSEPGYIMINGRISYAAGMLIAYVSGETKTFDKPEILINGGIAIDVLFSSDQLVMFSANTQPDKESMKKALVLLYCDKNVTKVCFDAVIEPA